MLKLRRRRQDGGFPAGGVAGQPDEGPAPSLSGRIDASPQEPASMPVAQQR
ncbi:hypothetical protein ACTMSW_29545 [Micromonospora sp. BQ11]|uniref:hypothetical protein n=1 Tax=Micromonospora sp. BQ11 TaxID=3452212 RepID=UPI003F8A4D14